MLRFVLLQAYKQAQEAGKELEVVYVPVADSAEVRKNESCSSKNKSSKKGQCGNTTTTTTVVIVRTTSPACWKRL